MDVHTWVCTIMDDYGYFCRIVEDREWLSLYMFLCIAVRDYDWLPMLIQWPWTGPWVQESCPGSIRVLARTHVGPAPGPYGSCPGPIRARRALLVKILSQRFRIVRNLSVHIKLIWFNTTESAIDGHVQKVFFACFGHSGSILDQYCLYYLYMFFENSV